MFKNFIKNKHGQNTAEYALLIALVVAGIIAMQQYAQRGLQARVRDASVFMADTARQSAAADAPVQMGATKQYEPYYQQSDYQVTRDSSENKRLDQGVIQQDASTQRDRAAGGHQTTTYNPAVGQGAPADMPAGI